MKDTRKQRKVAKAAAKTARRAASAIANVDTTKRPLLLLPIPAAAPRRTGGNALITDLVTNEVIFTHEQAAAILDATPSECRFFAHRIDATATRGIIMAYRYLHNDGILLLVREGRMATDADRLMKIIHERMGEPYLLGDRDGAEGAAVTTVEGVTLKRGRPLEWAYAAIEVDEDDRPASDPLPDMDISRPLVAA